MALNIPGLDSINVGDWSGVLSNFGNIALAIILLAGCVFAYFHFFGKKSNISKKTSLCVWYEEINGNVSWIGEDKGIEFVIPNTNIPILFIKSKNLYMPRPTRKMGRNLYWYFIKNNKEIINISMANINKEMTELELDYDHTDMRYASEYLRELLNINYKENSQPWYVRYQNLIQNVILLFVFIVGMWFVLDKVGGLITLSNSVVTTATNYASTVCSNPGSGVVLGG